MTAGAKGASPREGSYDVDARTRSEASPLSTMRPFDCWGFGDIALSRQLAAAFCVLHSTDFIATCPPSAAPVPDTTKADQNNTGRGERVHK
jgi:hypothetical protein